ncbi:MAG: glycan-binding surface protein [Bacteroidales bacterium]|nr:glycan-binding surface protein [Bacteroidales bacterium]
MIHINNSWFFLFVLVLFASSCNHKYDDTQFPEPDPTESRIEILISDFDGNGLFPDLWNSTNDGSEMTDYDLLPNPDSEQSDTSLYMAGTDKNNNWWVGTALGGDNMGDPFGLPADASKITIQFDLYAVNEYANIEIQLQEADGDVFSWNLGGDGGLSPSVGSWKTFQTVPLSEFNLADFNNGENGDKQLAPDLLANISLALISGNSTGNYTALYLDNVKFVVLETSYVATPTNLCAEAVSQSQIDLSWADNSDNETMFVIERAVADSEFQTLVTLDANASTYSDMGLQSSTSYVYRVQALYYQKQSNYSNVVTKKTLQGQVVTMLLSTFDNDEQGKLPGKWEQTSDVAELAEYGFVVNPLALESTDTVLFMQGTDSDSDWWIGTAIGGNRSAGEVFDLPADANKISIRFDLYAGNATTNLDLQLQEADGDTFVWNFGGDGGYQASEEEWVTYTVPLSDFYLSGFETSGDNVLAPELLSNVSIALISGNVQGNEAIAYINNVKFIISD